MLCSAGSSSTWKLFPVLSLILAFSVAFLSIESSGFSIDGVSFGFSGTTDEETLTSSTVVFAFRDASTSATRVEFCTESDVSAALASSSVSEEDTGVVDSVDAELVVGLTIGFTVKSA